MHTLLLALPLAAGALDTVKELAFGLGILMVSLWLLYGFFWLCGGVFGFMGWSFGGLIGLCIGTPLAMGIKQLGSGTGAQIAAGVIGGFSMIFCGAFGRLLVKGLTEERHERPGAYQILVDGGRNALAEVGFQIVGIAVGLALGFGVGALIAMALSDPQSAQEARAIGPLLGATIGFLAGWKWASVATDDGGEDPLWDGLFRD